MQTAYDPVRIQRLSTRTALAIDALAHIRSSDPAAADALRTVRLLRSNLQDLWMPLLRQIEASRAMTSWTSSAGDAATAFVIHHHESIRDWIDQHPSDLAARLRRMSDDELLVQLELIGDEGVPFDGINGPDLEERRWVAVFPTVAAEMARRVRADRGFAARLVEVAYDNPVVGLAIAHADFPTGYIRDVATVMLRRTSWVDDFESRVEAAAAGVALDALVDDPYACLTVLRDSAVLAELAAWPLLEQDVVARFVQSGLYRAVADDPGRLQQGYRVIGELTRLANTTLDDGFAPGVARGLATSMVGYVETLGRAIDKEDGGQVRVTTLGEGAFTIELGTYEELRNLFGATARDVEAQAALGVVLGAYMNTVMDDAGPDIATHSGVEHVAQFADLIGDAVTAEQAEMVAAAASATAQRGALAGAIGFASTSVLSAAGAGPLVGFVAGRVVKSVADQVTHVDAEVMPNGRLRHAAYDAIVVATVTLTRRDRDLLAAHGGDDDESLRQVDEHLARLAELDATEDAEAYRDEVSDMIDFIEQRTPELDALVSEIRSIPAVNELTEGHE